MFSQLLVSELFVFLLVFCRIGSAIMLMPGIGEIYVYPRIRLLLALALSALIMPVLKHSMPPPPSLVPDVFVMIAGEVLIGLFMGALTRIIISAVHTAGTVIATQSGLATAMMLDVTQTSQTTAVSNLMSVTAVTLFFAADLHHLLLMSFKESYGIFTPGQLPLFSDVASYGAESVTRAFAIAMHMASPILIVSILINLGSGILARLVPTIQIFFILLAPQILLSFFILMVTISGIMLWYVNRMQDAFENFLLFSS